jgi:hypothetical protein
MDRCPVQMCRPASIETNRRAYCSAVSRTGNQVEFPDEVTGIGEWMCVLVESCDDKKKLIFAPTR